ncbi:MAG TPA: TIGR01906 family membrane protein [Dehalococcoidia bacterium]|jgi:integral membrane protein (TIGR01906 family)|nr:TIGR01906 family membrane protein [Dehalococcoidia bacterium]
MERKVKILTAATWWLFILALPLLLVSASIAVAANSLPLYRYGFEKYHVSQTTGLDEAELEKAAAGLIRYFNSDEEYIRLTVLKDGQPFALFNQREVIHLKDVKRLFWLDYWVLLGTLIYALGYAGVSLWRKHRPKLARGLVRGGILTLALMLALGLGALLNFDRLFLQFHLLSFANEFWQLDPTRDYLIMLFPRGFWFDATLFCALLAAAGAIILSGLGEGYLFFSQKRTHRATTSPSPPSS